MHTLEVSHISKTFGSTCAVQDVSFEVEKGEIFGLLGPNGAGKTTTIRIILDIFRPDRGSVSILGGAMSESKKERIGYMPEERGLYQDIALERCLLYLASLKNVPEHEARSRLGDLLERFDLAEHKKKKVKELSKGMQQKAQIIVTLLHQPEFIIIDEPFASLDPINVQLAKDVLRELRQQGVTIIMSTHQMQQVEELCDRIVLINNGVNVLYGDLDEVRRQFSGHAVLVRADGDWSKIPGVKEISPHNDALKLTLTKDATPQGILESLVAARFTVEKFEVAIPALDEIFIRVVEEESRS
jgi:ABC-2 type transport system ATP-binding protein